MDEAKRGEHDLAVAQMTWRRAITEDLIWPRSLTTEQRDALRFLQECLRANCDILPPEMARSMAEVVLKLGRPARVYRTRERVVWDGEFPSRGVDAGDPDGVLVEVRYCEVND